MYRRPAAAPGNGPQLSEEELKRKSDALFAEFLSTLDKAEALTCVRELNAPAFMPLLVETGLTSMMNAMKDKVSVPVGSRYTAASISSSIKPALHEEFCQWGWVGHTWGSNSV